VKQPLCKAKEPIVGRPLIVRLTDEDWDLTLCERLEQLLAPALEQPNVVIDMAAVQFMDSSCLNKLIHMHNERVTKRGFSPVRLVIASPNIRRLFAIANLDRLWPIFETVDEACKHAGISDDMPFKESSSE
jgi:anti-anti-sigma factor